MSDLEIVAGDLSDPRLSDMLATHARLARAQTAPGSSHAIVDLDGFRSPEVGLWSVRDGQALVGVGAIRRLTPEHGEVKSMYTAPSARRCGVASMLLRHLVAVARSDRLSRLSLETGSWDYFGPARAFYGRHGFVVCAPFADYDPDPNSVFMTLDLAMV